MQMSHQQVWTSKQWHFQVVVERAVAKLRHITLVGTVVLDHAGLGGNPKPCYRKARVKESRKLIQEDVNA